MKLLIEKELEIDALTIYLSLFKLHKSYLLLISDQYDLGIGSVTLASPPSSAGLNSTVASYNLFGVDKKLLSTIIAEKTSHLLKAPTLLLLFIKSRKKEIELAKPISKILNEMLSKID